MKAKLRKRCDDLSTTITNYAICKTTNIAYIYIICVLIIGVVAGWVAYATYPNVALDPTSITKRCIGACLVTIASCLISGVIFSNLFMRKVKKYMFNNSNIEEFIITHMQLQEILAYEKNAYITKK